MGKSKRMQSSEKWGGKDTFASVSPITHSSFTGRRKKSVQNSWKLFILPISPLLLLTLASLTSWRQRSLTNYAWSFSTWVWIQNLSWKESYCWYVLIINIMMYCIVEKWSVIHCVRLCLKIVDKALEEPKYSQLYAQLCQRLAQDAPNFEDPSNESQTTQKQNTVRWFMRSICTNIISKLEKLSVNHVWFHIFRLSDGFWFQNFKMSLRTVPEMLKVRESCFLCCIHDIYRRCFFCFFVTYRHFYHRV